jgi:hypothetical protein
MPLEVNCPNCFKSYRLADGSTGRKVQCKACQQVFQVGEPALSPEPFPSVEPPPHRGPKRGLSNRGAGLSTPTTVARQPSVLQILLDFNMRHYYTPWVVRSSWTFAVLLYFLSWFGAAILSFWKLAPDFRLWTQGKLTFSQIMNDDGIFIGFLLVIEILLLSVLLTYRIILELMIVIFDISETLKTMRSESGEITGR